MSEITSLSHPLIKEVKLLRQGKPSRFTHHFLVEGKFEIEEAARAKVLLEVFTLDKNLVVEGIAVHDVTPHIMDQLSNHKTPSGYVGLCDAEKLPKIQGQRVLLLDQVTDPGNVGTLIRSAYAFGINTIYMTEQCAHYLNPKVIAATQGALFHVALFRMPSDQILQILKSIPTWYSTTLNPQSIDIATVNPTSSWVLVLGNETRGVSNAWQSKQPIAVHIPMKQFDSLNVAMAGSIALFELQKKAGML
jgi:RNA methyltransferase, TrmH family